MSKVIVIDMAFNKGVIAEGETDGKLIDNNYVKVNGELYHEFMVLTDTSEARCAVDLLVKVNKAANDAVSYVNLLSSRILYQYRNKTISK